MDQQAIEARFAALERRLSGLEQALVAPSVPVAPKTPSSPPVSSAPPVPRPVAAPRPPVPPVFGETFGEMKPGSWLGIVAVICFVLAAGFMVKLSVESGWLTPARQLGLAALFGLGLIGAGFMLMGSDREYASLLPGGGVIVLYLTTFAAHRYYGIIPFEVAIGLTGLVSGLCVWLYTQIKHDAYPFTAALGAYLAPVVLGLHVGAEFSLYYFLLCSVAFAAVSIWLESRLLAIVAAYLAVLMTAFVGDGLGTDILVAVMLGFHFLVFAVGTYAYSRQSGQVMRRDESYGFLPVMLIFYVAEYHFIGGVYPALAPWISLAFAGVLIGLYLSAKAWFADRKLESGSVILIFATIVCFHSLYLELLPAALTPWLLVLFLGGAALLPVSASAVREDLYFPFFALLAVGVIEYLSIVFHLIEGGGADWLLVALTAFAGFWLLLVNKGGELAEKEAYGYGILAAAHVLAVVSFYRLTQESGSLAVSASWLLYAVAVMAFAFARQDQVMARSALFVLGFAAGKALLYDAASAPTIIRILCLLLTGVVLYGCGLLMRRIAYWKPRSQA